MFSKVKKHRKRFNNKLSISAADFMPQDEFSQTILRERAEHLSKHEEEITGIVEIPYIRFGLANNELYGIPYSQSEEVIRDAVITPLPFSPKYVAGIINRRGLLLTIIDLKGFLHNQYEDLTKNLYIIVVTSKGMTIGILANNIQGSDQFEATSLARPLTVSESSKTNYILGIHRETTAIVDVDSIVRDLKKRLE